MCASPGQWSDAEADYVESVMERVRELLRQGKRGDAITVLDDSYESSASHPAFVRAHLSFLAGTFMLGFGQRQAATERLERAVAGEPTNPQYRLGLAGAQLDAGRPSDALSTSEEALGLARRDPFWSWIEPQLLGLKGCCLLRLGDEAGALELLEVFDARLDEGKPPNPWCDLRLARDLLKCGIGVASCRAYLRRVAAHAAETGDADLQWRVGPLLETS